MPVEGRALRDNVFDPAWFSVLTMPALFLVGSQTQEPMGEVLRALQPYMPQARWHVFEGHGHAATYTAPKDFTDTVLAFLADRES
jgi:pimeloyl-ACP methyl ester carboxylesterase